MAGRSKKRKSRRQKMTIPVSVVAGFAPGMVAMYRGYQEGGAPRLGYTAALVYTGYDMELKRWWPPAMMRGTVPIMLGTIIHKLANRLGVNRAMRNIPFIRL